LALVARLILTVVIQFSALLLQLAVALVVPKTIKEMMVALVVEVVLEIVLKTEALVIRHQRVLCRVMVLVLVNIPLVEITLEAVAVVQVRLV
tara:strand:- start:784 stop:1059 length:276 start_codon:yes stop_codon:yes gene_type:complete